MHSFGCQGKSVCIRNQSSVLVQIFFYIPLGEKQCSIHGHGERWVASSNCVRGNTEIEPDTMVKLIRKGCVR